MDDSHTENNSVKKLNVKKDLYKDYENEKNIHDLIKMIRM